MRFDEVVHAKFNLLIAKLLSLYNTFKMNKMDDSTIIMALIFLKQIDATRTYPGRDSIKFSTPLESVTLKIN